MKSNVTRVNFLDTNQPHVYESIAETQMSRKMNKSPKYKLNPEISWNMNRFWEHRLIAEIQISGQK